MMRRLAFAIVTVLLSSCAATDQPTSGRPSEFSRPSNPVFATQIAGPGTYLAPMPTAAVLLKPDDMTRNRAFCAAVAKLPTEQEATARSVVAPNLILTRWLTQLADVPAGRVRDCEFLVGTYDYSRAAALIASLHGSAGPMTGSGPFLVMMVPDNTGVRIAGVDGSSYASSDFDAFVLSWNRVIEQTQSRLSSFSGTPAQPGLVRSIFDLVVAVMRTVFGATAGLIQGTVRTL
ncbi:MAG: hypothetical protein JO128_14775 [Alphaproteobacteria bacterium]|nr:hypothetical protein [Alphaproteobacteria bacterium]